MPPKQAQMLTIHRILDSHMPVQVPVPALWGIQHGKKLCSLGERALALSSESEPAVILSNSFHSLGTHFFFVQLNIPIFQVLSGPIPILISHLKAANTTKQNYIGTGGAH